MNHNQIALARKKTLVGRPIELAEAEEIMEQDRQRIDDLEEEIKGWEAHVTALEYDTDSDRTRIEELEGEIKELLEQDNSAALDLTDELEIEIAKIVAKYDIPPADFLRLMNVLKKLQDYLK